MAGRTLALQIQIGNGLVQIVLGGCVAVFALVAERIVFGVVVVIQTVLYEKRIERLR